MKDPIQKYFQVGTIQWMTHPPVNYPILDSVMKAFFPENAVEYYVSYYDYYQPEAYFFSVGVRTLDMETSWFMKSMIDARNLLMSASM